jgi:hypothetical protein
VFALVAALTSVRNSGSHISSRYMSQRQSATAAATCSGVNPSVAA